MVPRWTVRLVFAAVVVGAVVVTGPASRAQAEDEELLDDEMFCTSLASEHFEIWSDAGLPLQRLIDVAEDTQRRTRAWLGLTPRGTGSRTRIHLVRSVASLDALEERNGLAPSRDVRDERSFHGRCYAEAGLVVIPIGTNAGLRWQIAHEVTHLVFHEVVGRNVPIANEGLAELLPDWILGANDGTPDRIDAQYAFYDRRVARAVLAREVPSFDEFLRVDAGRFYDPRADWLWYALSWKLARVLVERESTGMRGRFRDFLDAMARGDDVGSGLRSAYDFASIEAAWRDEVERSARWRPLFGEWRSEPDALVGSVAGPHSACATAWPPMLPGQGFDVALSLDGAPAPGLAFGFALEVRGDEDFVYVEFRPGCRSIVIAERDRGRWSRVVERVIAPELRPLCDGELRRFRIALHASADGQLEVRVDDQTILSHELGRNLAGGTAGVMLEQCGDAGSEAGRSELRFRDVRVTR